MRVKSHQEKIQAPPDRAVFMAKEGLMLGVVRGCSKSIFFLYTHLECMEPQVAGWIFTYTLGSRMDAYFWIYLQLLTIMYSIKSRGREINHECSSLLYFSSSSSYPW